MIPSRSKKRFTLILLAALAAIIFSGWTAAQAGVGFVYPPGLKYKYEFIPSRKGLSLSHIEQPAFFNLQPEYLKYTFEIDSASSLVVGKRTARDPYFARPAVYDPEIYRSQRMENEFIEAWRKENVKRLFATQAGSGGSALEIQIPWRVRSKTFQRIFGGDRVGLRVTGNITIDGGLRRQKDDRVSTTQNDRANYNFRIDQTQRFNIEGRVGDKVSVKIDQDSERMFDFENSLKLDYTGHEDEIIQKIEAGNISLSLAGTQLATFSGNNTGLFGLKTESRFGPLSLTSVASVEKGQKNKRSIKGGAEEQTQSIQAPDILRNRYFFLNEDYRKNFRRFDNDMNHVITSFARPIRQIEVYVSDDVRNTNTFQAWAMNSPGPHPDSSSRSNIQHYFRALTKDVDYSVDTRLGYIRLNSYLSKSQVLACAYELEDGTKFGDIPLPPDSVVTLKLLRPHNPQNTDSTWNLEMKNVYSLRASNIPKSDFRLKIFRIGTGSSDEETGTVNGEAKPYLEILGLDNRGDAGGPPDGSLDDNPALINWGRGELILPGLRPFDPDSSKPDAGYYRGDSLILPQIGLDSRMPTIYDTTADYPTVSTFRFDVKYSSVSASFSLGFNVLPGSEEVYLNGQRLTKGADYTIDYMTGALTILKEGAGSASANVEVLWESGELFQLDKKTLFGVRGEYDLWNEESFVGITALYLNEKPLEERVRVGNEPTRNFIWDANSRMVIKNDFITSAIDFLPLLEAENESEITLEGEIARVWPNPNSLNNPATGDNNGVAYLDDFESAKRVTTLGIMRRSWRPSSTPIGAVANRPDTVRWAMRGSMIWYNPFDQVKIKDIWPNRDVNTAVQNNIHVLDIEFSPVEDTLYNTCDIDESWEGIQKYLSAGYADQSKSKFLEMTVFSTGSQCTLHVDLGKVSEDVIPNGRLNTEDVPLPNLTQGNGILDPGEDIGIDEMSGANDFWDINEDNVKQDWERFSNDNFNYSASDKNNYQHINGTENNERDEGERIPDTEDLNGNGILENEESFFRCSIPLPLDENHPYFGGKGGENTDWYLIRVPLKEAQAVGQAAWNQIEFARLWLSGCTDDVKLRIATFELVGNEWEEVFPNEAGALKRERLEISTINTEENAADYIQPPGVRGQRDPVTNLIAREQSIVLKVIDLAPKATARAQKTFRNQVNFLEYNTLKMFVYGSDNIEEKGVEMSFRFGADTTSNYYEIYQRLKPGWNDDNQIEIDLREIPRLKLDRDALLLNPNFQTTAKVDSFQLANGSWRKFGYWKEPGEYGDSIVVVGNPSLSQIRQITVGLHNTTKSAIDEYDGVHIWMDELRLSDVKKDPGTAYRTSIDVNLSDLGTVHLNLNESDADFHNLNSRLGSGNNSQEKRISGNFNLDRFLPPTWGLRLPLNGNYQNNTTVPKYYPGSDILLASDDQAAIDTVKNQTVTKQWGIQFRKEGESSNPLIKYTVDKLSGNYDYNSSDGSSQYDVFNRTQRRSAGLNYNLSFGRFEGIAILAWAKKIPLLKKIHETKFNPLPNNITTGISGTRTITESLSRSNSYNQREDFGMTREVSSGARPFSNMNLDFSRSHRSDMRGNQWSDVAKLNFGRDYNVDQSLNYSYSPVIFKWLTQDVSYSSSYQWTWSNGYTEIGQSIRSHNTIRTSWNLRTSQLFKSSSPGPGGAGRGAASASRGVSPPGDVGAQEGEPEGEEGEKKEEKKIKIPNPLTLMKKMMAKVTDVRFDYSHTRDLGTPAVTGHAGWKYQLGLSKDPEVPQVAGYSGTETQNVSYNDDYRVKSGLRFSRSFSTTFDFDYKTSESYRGTTAGGQKSYSLFYLADDKGKINDFPFVNITAKLTGLEKLAIFNNLAQTVSVNSGFSGKYSSDWTVEKSNITKENFERNLSPLFGMNITWNGGISTNFDLKKTQKITNDIANLNNRKNRSNNTTISFTARYSRKSGFRIPIPVWPFNNKRFKNNTNFSLTFTSSNRDEQVLQGEGTKFSTTNKSTSWSLRPSLDYSFSNTVSGGVHYETGVNTNSSTGKSSFHEFGFNVRIEIRGR